MTKITIEIDKSNVTFIKSLVEKLNGKVINHSKPNADEALQYLKKISDNGNLKKQIVDAVEWQKEIREDRPLPLRD